jgi:hypothetical protein
MCRKATLRVRPPLLARPLHTLHSSPT